MIIPVYKPIGASSHQLAQAVGERVGEKATHTGTLDPMADGVLVVLTGQDRFQKETYSSTWKVYDVQVVAGIHTDTDDVLGLVKTVFTTGKVELKTLLSSAELLIGTITLPIHPFSAKRSNGSSYFELSKQGKDFIPATEEVTIKTLTVSLGQDIAADTLLEEVLKKIATVSGEFRQLEVIQSWKKSLLQLNKERHFQTLHLTIRCSKRTYVRSLVRKLSEQTQVPLTVLTLTRTLNEPYSIQDCLCLI